MHEGRKTKSLVQMHEVEQVNVLAFAAIAWEMLILMAITKALYDLCQQRQQLKAGRGQTLASAAGYERLCQRAEYTNKLIKY